jgi:hypothetical protein
VIIHKNFFSKLMKRIAACSFTHTAIYRTVCNIENHNLVCCVAFLQNLVFCIEKIGKRRRVSENGLRRAEVTVDWREMYNDDERDISDVKEGVMGKSCSTHEIKMRVNFDLQY